LSRSHTARNQGEAIHYPFHTRRGESAEIVRRDRFRGISMFVVRQRDGALVQIPIWMCALAAATMAVKDQLRL